MDTAQISFISEAEKVTLKAYQGSRSFSILGSEVISRLAAAILLSPAALLDFTFHTLMIFPTIVYAIGRSIYHREMDFTLPWQHLQRVRNAVAPLLLGTILGVIHPFAGLAVCETTDKHIAMGILVSNTNQSLETPCSPIHSLSLTASLARQHRYGEHDGEKVEIFSDKHVQILKGAKSLEESLERLQAQEYIHKITNITLFAMAKILDAIKYSYLDHWKKELLTRVSGLLIPILTAIDLTIALVAQAFFLVTGVVRLITGRGPMYTEVTTNPLMHASFLIQNILKMVGNLLGTLGWFINPMIGFRVSLLPAHAFFNLQMKILMLQIKWKISSAKENERFVVPILFGNGEDSVLSMPTHTMHKTYLIVEKKAGAFDLYWVNRPTITHKVGMTPQQALAQIGAMLDERFPFMDPEKLMNYPVKSKIPPFLEAKPFTTIASQGGSTNCVVSNLFGTFDALDRIDGAPQKVTDVRNQVVRQALMRDYGFYKNNFSPFGGESSGYSLIGTWKQCKQFPRASI